MAVKHNGKEAPLLPDRMHPDAQNFIWMTWKNPLNGAAMLTSAWLLPPGFTEVDSAQNVTITVDNIEYQNVNWVLLSTTLTEGTHLIQNSISADSGLVDIKGAKITIDADI
jgi:hypothetical protein